MDIEVAMLTGDSEDVARAVSEELGIDQYFAEVLPEEKDTKVEQLSRRKIRRDGRRRRQRRTGAHESRRRYRHRLGDRCRHRVGDIILVDNNPLDVVRLIRLSKASYHRKMQENLVWATGYNVFALPLAAESSPHRHPPVAAIGAVFMSLSTIIVAINARRLGNVDLSVPA